MSLIFVNVQQQCSFCVVRNNNNIVIVMHYTTLPFLVNGVDLECNFIFIVKVTLPKMYINTNQTQTA